MLHQDYMLVDETKGPRINTPAHDGLAASDMCTSMPLGVFKVFWTKIRGGMSISMSLGVLKFVRINSQMIIIMLQMQR